MRGKERYRSHCAESNGITPAHAGKRNYCGVMAKRNEDHPRPCGEKNPLWITYPLESGSPPPMRGKGPRYGGYYYDTRITPAHAGKRYNRAWERGDGRDHPRPCGEKPSPLLFARREPGSPPPMRGKDTSGEPRLIPLGITPAHAGKSAPEMTRRSM